MLDLLWATVAEIVFADSQGGDSYLTKLPFADQQFVWDVDRRAVFSVCC